MIQQRTNLWPRGIWPPIAAWLGHIGVSSVSVEDRGDEGVPYVRPLGVGVLRYRAPVDAWDALAAGPRRVFLDDTQFAVWSTNDFSFRTVHVLKLRKSDLSPGFNLFREIVREVPPARMAAPKMSSAFLHSALLGERVECSKQKPYPKPGDWVLCAGTQVPMKTLKSAGYGGVLRGEVEFCAQIRIFE